MRRPLPLVAASIVLAVLAGCSALGADADPVTRWASPTGGGDCTEDSPCDIRTAVARSAPGSTVRLLAGDYGDVELTASGGGPEQAASIVVEAADPDAPPSFSRLRVGAPSLLWRDIRVTGPWFLDRGAEGTRLEAVHLDGGGLFVRTTGAEVVDSLFENGSSIDGIQIGGASDVLIEGNVIRDYDQSGSSGLHADCIQVFDSSAVTLRANSLANCYNAGIILSPGEGRGIAGIVIESNFIQGCVVPSTRCVGGSAVDLRESRTTGLVVRNNTILNGSTRLRSAAGDIVDRNIIGYLSDCTARATNSVVIGWNGRQCAAPAMIGVDGNVIGSPSFVDQAAGDLHLTDHATAALSPAPGTSPASTDRDGDVVDPAVAGADSPPGGTPPAPSAPPSTPGAPPSPGPTEPVVGSPALPSALAELCARQAEMPSLTPAQRVLVRQLVARLDTDQRALLAAAGCVIPA